MKNKKVINESILKIMEEILPDLVQICLLIIIFQETDRFLFLILIWEEKHARSQISAQEIYFLPNYTQTEVSFNYKQVTCYWKVKI